MLSLFLPLVYAEIDWNDPQWAEGLKGLTWKSIKMSILIESAISAFYCKV